MKTVISALLLLILISNTLFAQWDSTSYGNDVLTPPSAIPFIQTCSNASPAYVAKYGRVAHYIPDANTPVKTILLNFIFWQKDDGTENWQNTSAVIARLDQIMIWLNDFYDSNNAPSDTIPGVPFISDTKIRFEADYYFYQNSAMWASSSISALNAELASIDPDKLKRLNIHVTAGNLGPNNTGAAYIPSFSDFDFNSGIITLNYEGDPVGDYAFSTHLAHELGHFLDLLHTYTPTNETCNQLDPDYLDDVFGSGISAICPQNHGWSCNPTLSTNTCTNNIMGGTQSAHYFSPKQMGKMHRALAISSVRKYVKDCPVSSVPLSITTSEVWDFNVRMYRDIHIEAGASLTITCKVLMPDDAKIIVKPGAQLIINGGTITGACSGNWQGIEVWGQPSLPQSPLTQGSVYITDGLIEDAKLGVTLSKSGDCCGFNGGFIRATNSTFRNNRKSVEFMRYRMTVGGGNVEIPNKSWFENCDFICNAPMKDASYGGLGVHTFVSLWDVTGVNFRGCRFINTYGFDIDDRGTGIYSEDAAYSVTAIYDPKQSPQGGASINKRGEFVGLTKGISATMSLSSLKNRVQVRDNTFADVQQGISGNMNFCSISGNIMTVPESVNSMTFPDPWAIFLEDASSFNIADNTIMGNIVASNYGLIIHNSGTLGGTVRANDFGNLEVGTQTEENNPNLKLSCNTYTGTTKAWDLNPASTGASYFLANQGTGCLPGDTRAGNEFNDAAGTNNHIHSHMTNSFNYYGWGFPASTNPTGVSGNVNVTNCASAVPDVTCIPCVGPPCTERVQQAATSASRLAVVNELIGYYLEENNNEQIIRLLEEMQTTTGVLPYETLLPVYITTGKLQEARKLLNQLVVSGKADPLFYEFYQLMLDHTSAGKSLFDLEISQLQRISAIAGSASPVASNAKAILSLVQEKTYFSYPEKDNDLVKNKQDIIPGKNGLKPYISENIPNPFDRTTLINAFIPDYTQGEVVVYNVVGELVKRFILDQGEHTVVINGTELKKGLYFYTLIVNGRKTETKKMIVF